MVSGRSSMTAIHVWLGTNCVTSSGRSQSHCHPASLYLCKKDGIDQESIQLSTTPDPGYQWKSGNVTIRHHKREPRGQPFPSR